MKVRFKKEAGFSFLFLILSLFLSGCASMDATDYRQPVLVLSDPPGAKVYDYDGRFAGITPDYIKLRRKFRPEIELEWPDGSTRSVRLDRKYRWGEAFGMNFLWLPFGLTPLALVTDLMTGNAWQLEDPPLQILGEGKGWPQGRVPTMVAIAPPTGVEPELADSLGFVLSDRLQEGAKFKIWNYGDSVQLFRFNHSDQGLSERKEDRYRLFSSLKADHVLYSQIERRGEKFFVKSELRDTVTTKNYKSYEWEISPGNEELRQEFTAKTFFNEYVHLAPNTAFFSFSAYTPTVEIGGVKHDGKEVNRGGFAEDVFRYLSGLSIARLERSQFNRSGSWVFDFVPMIIFQRKDIEFPNYTGTDTSFRRWYISGGYGFEGGYMGRYGLVYADIAPSLLWSEINYESPRKNGSVSRASLSMVLEAGYSYFFSDHLVGRLFVRQLGEDPELWNQALSQVNGTDVRTKEVNSAFVGVSVGYYLPSSLKSRKGWRVQKR